MAFTTPFERERQVGYLRVRFLSNRFRFFTPDHVIISFSSCFLLMMGFNFLTMFCPLGCCCRQKVCSAQAQSDQRPNSQLFSKVRDFCKRGQAAESSPF